MRRELKKTYNVARIRDRRVATLHRVNGLLQERRCRAKNEEMGK